MTDALRATLGAIRAKTLVLDGGATFPFLKATAELVASVIPGAERMTLEGQQHDVAAEVIAAVLADFFGQERSQ